MPSFILQIISSSPNLRNVGSTERSSYNTKGSRDLLMREEQRYPHQHRDTDTERKAQRVSEKETEAGHQEWGTEHTAPGKQTEG